MPFSGFFVLFLEIIIFIITKCNSKLSRSVTLIITALIFSTLIISPLPVCRQKYCSFAINHFFVRMSIFLDPVLTYVSNGINTATVDQLKNACLSFYTLDELFTARDTLWQAAGETVLGRLIQRRDSVVGQASFKTIEDIISGVTKLMTAEKLPVFAVDAARLRRIPKAAPEETLPVSLCERMNNAESKIDQLTSLFERVTSLEGRVMTLQAPKTKQGQGKHPLSLPPPGAAAAVDPGAGKAATLPTGTERTTAQVLADALKDNKEPFVDPKGGKGSRNRNNRRPNLQGKNADANADLKGGRIHFTLQLTNVNPEITVDKVRSYIKKKNENVEIIKIKDTSTDHWPTKRFLVDFKQVDYATVVDPDFWPPKVYYRQYFPARQNKTTNNHHD